MNVSNFTAHNETARLLEEVSKFPAWLIWLTCLTLIVAGGFISNALLAAYLARRRAFPAVMHLALTDIASLLFLAPYEIIFLADGTGVWAYPIEYCSVFLGLEVLLGTATVYILIVINFSTMSGNEKKSMMVPLIIVWLLAMSLSIPDFIFADVIVPRPEYELCSLPKRAAFLVGAFRLALPVFLLVIGSIITIYNIFDPPSERPLYLALVLSLTYLIFSVQRSVFGVLYGLLSPLTGPEAFRTPPLADVADSPMITLILSFLHYTLSAVRPLISWAVTPSMRTVGQPVNPNV